ncbi:MAG: MATE family efflux transporter [Halobacteriovoraceae bacterium]|nr:MATE family efflux transporter [Halobacteriovoraceae bacterium]
MKLTGLRLRDLFWFSVPSIISSVFEPLASIVDTALVGNLNTLSLASLALATTLFNSITWMFNFLVHASTQGVADFAASKSDSLLRARIKISLTTALVVGVSCSIALVIPKGFWFSLVGGKASQVELFDSYFLPRTYFHVFTVLSLTTLSLLRGFGRLRLVLFLMVFSSTINIGLSYLFLYPMDMGVRGAAYGTVISHFLTFVLSIIFLIKEEKVGLRFLSAPTEKENWLKFGKNSLDLFGRSFTLTACFFGATRLASRLGVEPLGAHQVLLQVWLLASFFLDGLAISGNILGARFYFADQFKRTAIVFRKLLDLGFFVGLGFTLLYLFGWSEILGLFSQDLLVIAEMEKVRVLIIASQLISAVAFVFDGLIFGLDGFHWLRKHMIFGALFVFLPLSLVSLYHPSLVWIWLGLVSLNAYRGITGFLFVRKKVWKKID